MLVQSTVLKHSEDATSTTACIRAANHVRRQVYQKMNYLPLIGISSENDTNLESVQTTCDSLRLVYVTSPPPYAGRLEASSFHQATSRPGKC